MSKREIIPVAKGDGIGPEIMDAALHILLEGGAMIEPKFIELGEKVYLAGHTSGITAETWEIIRNNRLLYKAPITTPQGGGYKSLNVTIRKSLNLYANVRPVVSYSPVVPSKHPDMNVVIVRENEEDLYAGIEHQQTPEVVQCLKLISRPGCERVVRYAFEYARAYGRQKVTCMTKDNIMKLTDGLFHKVFDEIAAEYPDIENEHWIVDIGIALLADTPTNFDVVVIPNLYGDIASDVTAQVAGSIGLAPSANVGERYAMFEAIHGSAPDIAGKNIANPSGLLLSGINMLVYIGQNEVAERVHNAWLKTIEDRVWTRDIVKKAAGQTGYTEVGTKEFAKAIVARLGQKPTLLKPVDYSQAVVSFKKPKLTNVRNDVMQLDGVDLFIANGVLSANELGKKLEQIAGPEFRLIMLSNRGQVVYPGGFPETFCTDHWRCRFQAAAGQDRPTHAAIRNLMVRVEQDGLEWIKLENLYLLNGQRAYTLGQGQ